MSVLDHAPNMQAVASKLPGNLQAKWRDQVFKKKNGEKGVACFADLAEFVGYASESASDPVFGREALNRSKDDNKSPKVKEPPNKGKELSNKTRTPLKKLLTEWKYQESSLATNSSVKPPVSDGAGLPSNHGNRSCYFCSRVHDMDNCELFSKKTPELKRELLREKNMCFACYGTGHLSKNCSNRRKCKHCGRLHPSALHIDGCQLPRKDNSGPVKQENDKALNNACTNPEAASCHAAKSNESAILHAILPVRVKTKGNTKSVITYAFYDNGSGGCFLTENLREQLGVDGERTELQLGTVHGQSLVTTTVVHDLVVTDMEDE